jgi:hypothetical protein
MQYTCAVSVLELMQFLEHFQALLVFPHTSLSGGLVQMVDCGGILLLDN